MTRLKKLERDFTTADIAAVNDLLATPLPCGELLLVPLDL